MPHDKKVTKWAAFTPNVFISPSDPGVGEMADMAFRSRVKAMRHWIRKQNPERAARSARDAAHVANAILRRMGANYHV